MENSDKVVEIGKGIRLHYIDVMKGVTMLFVVLHHVFWLCGEHGISNSVTHIMLRHQQLYVCFIMPAFFFITGYCSSFDKKITKFFISNFKALIIPSITLGLIIELLHERWDLWTYIKGSIYLGFFSFWFLYALFYSKFLYYMLRHCAHRKSIIFPLLIFLAFLGAYLSDTKIVRNFGMMWQVFNLTIYLALGNLIRNCTIEQKVIKYGSIIYVFLAILSIVGLIEMPCVTAAFSSTLRLEPLHFLSAFSGCLFVFYACKKIDKCKLLKKIGKYSLVIYILHCEFINLFLSAVNAGKINQLNNFATICFLLGIFVSAVGLSCLVSYILNLKYFCWMLGKINLKFL